MDFRQPVSFFFFGFFVNITIKPCFNQLGNHYLLPEGYGSLIYPLANDLNVLTSKVATNVSYDGEGVVVTTRDNEV